MSSAPTVASGSHKKPATSRPSCKTTRPIDSGAGTLATNVPKAAASSDHTSTSTSPAPGSVGSTRTNPGFGKSVGKA
jgi:hypothetical protein